MRGKGTGAISVLAVAAMLGAGCGDGGDVTEGVADTGGNAGVELTKLLPTTSDFYGAADFAAIRDGRGLPADDGLDDPALAAFTGPVLAPVFSAFDPDILDALQLGRVSAAASSGAGGEGISVLATDADTGEIGSALGDLGFEERDGSLVDDDTSLAIRLDDGLIFVAPDAKVLGTIPDEAASEPPNELLAALDAPLISTIATDSDCFRATAITAEPDLSGEVVFEVDGGADAGKVEVDGPDSFDFGAPEADGDLASVSVAFSDDANDPPKQASAANSAFSLFAINYDC